MNPKILDAKKAKVADLTGLVENSSCVIVVGYQGLAVKDLTILRQKLKKVNAKLAIHKNTLMRRSVTSESLNNLEPLLVGANALITSAESTSALPVLQEFAKKNKALKIKGAVIENTFCDQAKLEALGNCGGKEGALSMLLSVLQAPIRQFAVACKAVAEQKQ